MSDTYRPVVAVENPTFVIDCEDDLRNDIIYISATRQSTKGHHIWVRPDAGSRFISRAEAEELCAVLNAWLTTGKLPKVVKKDECKRVGFRAVQYETPLPWYVEEIWELGTATRTISTAVATEEEVREKFLNPEPPK